MSCNEEKNPILSRLPCLLTSFGRIFLPSFFSWPHHILISLQYFPINQIYYPLDTTVKSTWSFWWPQPKIAQPSPAHLCQKAALDRTAARPNRNNPITNLDEYNFTVILHINLHQRERKWNAFGQREILSFSRFAHHHHVSPHNPAHLSTTPARRCAILDFRHHYP